MLGRSRRNESKMGWTHIGTQPLHLRIRIPKFVPLYSLRIEDRLLENMGVAHCLRHDKYQMRGRHGTQNTLRC